MNYEEEMPRSKIEKYEYVSDAIKVLKKDMLEKMKENDDNPYWYDYTIYDEKSEIKLIAVYDERRKNNT
jgi:hypothetical protein